MEMQAGGGGNPITLTGKRAKRLERASLSGNISGLRAIRVLLRQLLGEMGTSGTSSLLAKW